MQTKPSGVGSVKPAHASEVPLSWAARACSRIVIVTDAVEHEGDTVRNLGGPSPQAAASREPRTRRRTHHTFRWLNDGLAKHRELPMAMDPSEVAAAVEEILAEARADPGTCAPKVADALSRLLKKRLSSARRASRAELGVSALGADGRMRAGLKRPSAPDQAARADEPSGNDQPTAPVPRSRCRTSRPGCIASCTTKRLFYEVGNERGARADVFRDVDVRAGPLRSDRTGPGIPDECAILAAEPVDLRRGHDGLTALVRARFKMDPLGGDLFVFVGRRIDRVKVLPWDRGGLSFSTNVSRALASDWAPENPTPYTSKSTSATSKSIQETFDSLLVAMDPDPRRVRNLRGALRSLRDAAGWPRRAAPSRSTGGAIGHADLQRATRCLLASAPALRAPARNFASTSVAYSGSSQIAVPGSMPLE
jgi:hypothetical protein